METTYCCPHSVLLQNVPTRSRPHRLLRGSQLDQGSPTRSQWWHCLWQLRWFFSREGRWGSPQGNSATSSLHLLEGSPVLPAKHLKETYILVWHESRITWSPTCFLSWNWPLGRWTPSLIRCLHPTLRDSVIQMVKNPNDFPTLGCKSRTCTCCPQSRGKHTQPCFQPWCPSSCTGCARSTSCSPQSSRLSGVKFTNIKLYSYICLLYLLPLWHSGILACSNSWWHI